MNIHSLARSCPASRELLVRRVRVEHWKVSDAAAAAGVSERTAHKWLCRHRSDGKAGLSDRSSRPHRMPTKTPPDWEAQVIELRRSHRMTSPHIARRLRLPKATVCRILHRAGLSRLSVLDEKPPVRRYERKHPGELLHIDIKKLGRIHGVGHRITGDRATAERGYKVGWEFVHVCIDDASRVAYVEVLDDEKTLTSMAFLRRAVAWFERQGIRVERVMTDNGSCYRSRDFAQLCVELELKHIKTRPYTPRTNGKAERFIQTLLREWAYVMPYSSSKLRLRALPRWLLYYNRRRPHCALAGRSPFERLGARA